MLYCDLTLPTPQENLALDEALLDAAEEGETGETLRFWEPANYAVVVGYANRVATEVNLVYCASNGIPVLRRCTGGGTVLQGPGILNYSLVLRIDTQGPTHSITATNQFVMERQRQVVAALVGKDVQVCGHTDLTINNLKFSGNAQRRKRNYLIFHGAILLELDLALVEKALPMPAKQPDYRTNRSHALFLMNLHQRATDVKTALKSAWKSSMPLPKVPFSRITALIRDKYSLDHWNLKF